MRLSDFDFELPEDLIALRPVRPRPASRFLVADGGRTEEGIVRDLQRWLRPGDCLVFNDTKVLPARLSGLRLRDSSDGTGEAKVEATLIRREDASAWWALARPGKRLQAGDRIVFGELAANVAEKSEDGRVLLAFETSGPELDAAISAVGRMPLPPYIESRRPADRNDLDDYQTIFARRPGAVAAPTASLHFDAALRDALTASGIRSATLTLHVGAGTFLPVKTEELADHRMHAEWGEITPEGAAAINDARAAGGRIIPVGTTALRLIESAADEEGRVHAWHGDTDIFIRPGYRFRVTDGLMTNFHLPRSTLFMLVAALMGLERMQALYAEAIARRFRFYSYGDSSLLLPKGN